MPRFLVAALLTASASHLALAVAPQTWLENQPAQIEDGQFEKTISNSLGQIELANTLVDLLTEREDVGFVHSLAQADDGAVYAGTGPNGHVVRCDGDEVTNVFRAQGGGHVWSLLAIGDVLLAGVDGTVATVYTIDLTSNRKRKLARLEGAQYVWAMAAGQDGTIYAATGPEGKLMAIAPDATVTTIYDAEDDNLLCLAIDNDGMLYAGTDGRGLVLRIDPSTSKAFVLFDAPEDEIGAILLDDDGSVCVGTSAAAQAKPGRKPAERPGGLPLPPTTAEGNPITPNPTATMPATGAPARPVLAGRPPTVPPRGKKIPPGNAIYRIAPSGFVTELFRESAMVLGISKLGERIIAATGNEGRVYAIDPTTDIVTILTKLTSAQAESLLATNKGALYVGAANSGALHRLGPDRATEGTFTSRVLDATQVSHWGQATVTAKTTDAATLTVAFRSGNVETPAEGEEVWTDWSDELDPADPVAIPVASAKYLQYRLKLATTDPAATPLVDMVEIVHQHSNHPPVVEDLKVDPAGNAAPKGRPAPSTGDADPEPQASWTASWKATDVNGDNMLYNVYFRPEGDTKWIQMAEELTKPQHTWNTRTVADGRYELRVTAVDTPSNPPASALAGSRISDPVVIDNSPPVIADLTSTASGSDKVRLQASVKDDWTNLAACSYSIDSNMEWAAVLPTDGIFDSRSEQIDFEVAGLEPGEHRIAIRVVDFQNNTAYAVVSVTTGPE